MSPTAKTDSSMRVLVDKSQNKYKKFLSNNMFDHVDEEFLEMLYVS